MMCSGPRVQWWLGAADWANGCGICGPSVQQRRATPHRERRPPGGRSHPGGSQRRVGKREQWQGEEPGLCRGPLDCDGRAWRAQTQKKKLLLGPLAPL
ncbi:hypothetical protein NDU88_001427 [Pleurodeles waltl]|uniref:Uncharacterized protein n=1 Tax=Pleurodeles waltl TaxID=8319 RepID=A0AAV7NAQ0_PLEWA|nr:hypothetical protein NDU88_001427 [Pleurodeles waltl]